MAINSFESTCKFLKNQNQNEKLCIRSIRGIAINMVFTMRFIAEIPCAMAS